MIFLETVGTGQSDVEVVGIADAVLLVLMPGSGDSVQALKAGIMEIPDVIVINKMDHPGAKAMLGDVRAVLALDPEVERRPQLLSTEALGGEGVEQLWNVLERLLAALAEGGELDARRRRNLAGEVIAVATGRARERDRAGARERRRARRDARGGAAARARPPDGGGGGRGRGLQTTKRWNARRSLTSRRPGPVSTGSPASPPCFASSTLERLVGRPVLLKAENLQLTGAFKIRGAFNTIAQLTGGERQAGVVTASAGNHGQAVAWAARQAGIRATIFVPEGAPMAKVEAARGYGAAVELAGEGFDEAVDAAHAYEAEAGATFVHAFDDPRIIAGQGTLGLELAEQLPPGAWHGGDPDRRRRAGVGRRDRVARPATRSGSDRRPGRGCAPFAGMAPSGPTIADGIAVKHPAELTSAILGDLLDEVVVVDDEAISQAIVLLLERSKLVVEGAGAAPVAALVAGLVPGTGPVCAVLAGGNIDATTLMSVTRYGLTASGRYLVVAIVIPDRPGELANIVAAIARERANVLAVTHYREGSHDRRPRDGGRAHTRDARRGTLPRR